MFQRSLPKSEQTFSTSVFYCCLTSLQFLGWRFGIIILSLYDGKVCVMMYRILYRTEETNYNNTLIFFSFTVFTIKIFFSWENKRRMFLQVLSLVTDKDAFFVTWRMNCSEDVGQKRYSPMALEMILDQMMSSNSPNSPNVNAVWVSLRMLIISLRSDDTIPRFMLWLCHAWCGQQTAMWKLSWAQSWRYRKLYHETC